MDVKCPLLHVDLVLRSLLPEADLSVDSDLNALVMDYLISQGYPGAARNFAHEANIVPMLDVPSVEERVSIREALYRGDILGAIERINELDPQVRSYNHAVLRKQTFHVHCNDYNSSCTTHIPFRGVDDKNTQTTSVLSLSNDISQTHIVFRAFMVHLLTFPAKLLDRDPSLHFALLRLQLIELIRPVLHNLDSPIDHICAFAEKNLAPRASVEPKSLDDLEEAMGLLIFDPDTLAPPMAALLQPELRQEVGQRVNQALLASCGERTKANLYDLVNHRAWANQKAIEAKKEHLPDRIELGVESPKNGHEAPQNGSSHHSNGQREIMATGWEQY